MNGHRVNPVWSLSGGKYVISQLNDEFHDCPRKGSIQNKQSKKNIWKKVSHKRPTEVSGMVITGTFPFTYASRLMPDAIHGKQIFPPCTYCLHYSCIVALKFGIYLVPLV